MVSHSLLLCVVRCELEYKRLQAFIQEQAGPANTPSDDEDYVDAVTSVSIAFAYKVRA